MRAESKLKGLSVFFPFYNEEKNVKNVVSKALPVIKRNADKWELLLINDGSKDNTLKECRVVAKKDRRIEVINHKKNKGYGGALKSGYESAKYDWVAFSDADGQFDFSEINKFIVLQKKTGADLVLGIRKDRADSQMRKLYTFVWSKLLPRLLFGLKVTDYSCGFKLVRKKVYDEVQPLVGEEKVTQIEMLVKAQKMGFKFAEVKVGHFPRKHGKQTGADLKVVLRSMRDLIKLWWQLK